MATKRILQFLMVVAILVMSCASTGRALAWSGCSGYITVQWGDTLSSLASSCGTTVEAIQAANPGMGWWLYAGQVLNMPTGYNASTVAYYPQQMGSSTYVVQSGDTLGGIAMLYGVAMSDLLSVNPQIVNASLIFPGQVINLPASAHLGSNNYATSSYPWNNSSPNNYLTLTYVNTSAPPPVVSSPFANLEVTYGHGLLVRSGPGQNFSEIKSQYVSAVKFSKWQYRKNSLTTDSVGFIWVEVTLSPLVSGYSTGWIMVRDSLGTYFTFPNIGPKIDPNDP
jgi:LysM repeat protein